MSEKPDSGNDPLEKIVLFAGRREPVDPARAERVEQNAQQRWEMMLARRSNEQRRRRMTIFGGGLAVAASVVLAVVFMSRLAVEAPIVATVAKLVGAPETGPRGQAMIALQGGAQLRAGTVLETAEGDGAALQLVSGHSLRLAASTRIRLESDSVVLDAGGIYLDSGGDGQATPIEVRSRVASVRELGTQYMVNLVGNSLEVSVREGTVVVNRDAATDTARAGELLTLDQTGVAQRTNINEFGEHWAWAVQLATVPDIEGQSLAYFLQWLTREQGWQLEFASSGLARAASSVELHGSIIGLSGEEALEVVMASTGWRYQLADGALTIAARGGQ